MKSRDAYRPFFTSPAHLKRMEQMRAGAGAFVRWWQTILSYGLASWYQSYRRDLELFSRNFVDEGMGNLARRLRVLSETEFSAADWEETVVYELSMVFLICKAILHQDQIAPELAEEVFHLSGISIFQREMEARPAVRKRLLCIGQESGTEEQIVWRRNIYMEEDTSLVHFTYETAFRFFEKNEKPAVGEIFDATFSYYPGCSFGPGRIHIFEKTVTDDLLFQPGIKLNSFEKWCRYRAHLLSSRPWLTGFSLLVTGAELRCFKGRIYLCTADTGKELSLPPTSFLQPADFSGGWPSLPGTGYILEDSPRKTVLYGAVESASLVVF